MFDDRLEDGNAILHVFANAVYFFRRTIRLGKVVWTAAGHFSSREVVIVHSEVHLAERAVIEDADRVQPVVQLDLGPVNCLFIVAFLLGDGLDLRPLGFGLKRLPHGGGAIGELDLLLGLGWCRDEEQTQQSGREDKNRLHGNPFRLDERRNRILRDVHPGISVCFACEGRSSATIPPIMKITLTEATEHDALAIAILHTAVAERLTRDFGRGHWSSALSQQGVLYSMRQTRVFVARERATIVGTLQLATKKPWAIDTSYFVPCKRPLYLTAMAVEPAKQRTGIGRAMLDDAKRVARAWPGDAIRLDAYDSAAGAGAFYAKCGFREVGRATYRETPLIYYDLIL